MADVVFINAEICFDFGDFVGCMAVKGGERGGYGVFLETELLRFVLKKIQVELD